LLPWLSTSSLYSPLSTVAPRDPLGVPGISLHRAFCTGSTLLCLLSVLCRVDESTKLERAKAQRGHCSGEVTHMTRTTGSPPPALPGPVAPRCLGAVGRMSVRDYRCQDECIKADGPLCCKTSGTMRTSKSERHKKRSGRGPRWPLPDWN